MLKPVRRPRPLRWVLSGASALFAALLLGARAGPPWEAGFVIAGFLAFVFGVRHALAFLRVDEIVFDRPENPEPEGAERPRLAAAAFLLTLVAAGALAQQTIFNVPSADVLEKGKTYLEEDSLWRPRDPRFAVFTVRGVWGFGARVEGGVNVGGFSTRGRSTPTATAALKWQPVKVGSFALTTGAQGLFFLPGTEDGDPAGQFYALASYALRTNTRVTAGGWLATAGYAAARGARGGLFALEQKVNDHLSVCADWFTGRNGIGYLTPGIVSALGPWTVYAGYSFKNGDSKGNALLIELGFAF